MADLRILAIYNGAYCLILLLLACSCLVNWSGTLRCDDDLLEYFDEFTDYDGGCGFYE